MPPKQRGRGKGASSETTTAASGKSAQREQSARKEVPKTEGQDEDLTDEKEVKETNGKSLSKRKPTKEAGIDNVESDEKLPNAKEQEAKKNNKRKKAPGDDASGKPSKIPREGARRSARGEAKGQPSHLQLLKYLLSDEALEICQPEDEKDFLREKGDKAKTYSSSVLNPYEELMCTVILSKPLSHRLGMRSIRTLLNEPYAFNSARKTQSAGPEKVHQAFEDARAQHKDKTAQQINRLADLVLEKYSDKSDKEGTELGLVLKEAGGDVDKVLDVLKEDINGFGKTSMGIFLRRIQWFWDDAYPFIDEKTSGSLKEIGLPEYPNELQAAINDNWKQLDTKALAGSNEDAKKRRAFVIVLERAIGAHLESKVDEFLRAAAGA